MWQRLDISAHRRDEYGVDVGALHGEILYMYIVCQIHSARASQEELMSLHKTPNTHVIFYHHGSPPRMCSNLYTLRSTTFFAPPDGATASAIVHFTCNIEGFYTVATRSRLFQCLNRKSSLLFPSSVVLFK